MTENEWTWKVEDVAKHLGMSRDWVFDRARDGTLPSKRFGRLIRFSPAQIQAWIAAQPSAAETR